MERQKKVGLRSDSKTRGQKKIIEQEGDKPGSRSGSPITKKKEEKGSRPETPVPVLEKEVDSNDPDTSDEETGSQKGEVFSTIAEPIITSRPSTPVRQYTPELRKNIELEKGGSRMPFTDPEESPVDVRQMFEAMMDKIDNKFSEQEKKMEHNFERQEKRTEELKKEQSQEFGDHLENVKQEQAKIRVELNKVTQKIDKNQKEQREYIEEKISGLNEDIIENIGKLSERISKNEEREIEIENRIEDLEKVTSSYEENLEKHEKKVEKMEKKINMNKELVVAEIKYLREKQMETEEEINLMKKEKQEEKRSQRDKDQEIEQISQRMNELEIKIEKSSTLFSPIKTNIQEEMNKAQKERLAAARSAFQLETPQPQKDHPPFGIPDVWNQNMIGKAGKISEKCYFSNMKTGIPTDFLRSLKLEYQAYGKYLIFENFIQDHLRDRAAVWFSIQKEKIQTIEQFESEFLKQFWGREYDNLIQNEIHHDNYFNHLNQAPDQYLSRLVLRARACETPMTDDYLCKVIGNHFGNKVNDMIVGQGVKEIERFLEVLDYVGKEEMIKTKQKGKESRSEEPWKSKFVPNPGYKGDKGPEKYREDQNWKRPGYRENQSYGRTDYKGNQNWGKQEYQGPSQSNQQNYWRNNRNSEGYRNQQFQKSNNEPKNKQVNKIQVDDGRGRNNRNKSWWNKKHFQGKRRFSESQDEEERNPPKFRAMNYEEEREEVSDGRELEVEQ